MSVKLIRKLFKLVVVLKITICIALHYLYHAASIFFLTVYLCIGFKVVVQHINTDGEVSSVVWIGAVPSLRTKLPPLYHHRMEVDQGEENALELSFTRAHLKCVL